MKKRNYKIVIEIEAEGEASTIDSRIEFMERVLPEWIDVAGIDQDKNFYKFTTKKVKIKKK